MAEAKSKTTPSTDVADRVIMPGIDETVYKEAYAEGRELVGKPKTVDPYENPELNILNQDGFIGTDPIYQNYASIGGRPLNGEDKVGRAKASDGSVPDLEDAEIDATETGSNPNSDNSNAETTETKSAPAVVPPIPTSK